MARFLSLFILLTCSPAAVRAQPCTDSDGDGYGVYPGTSTLAGCKHDGIDCDDKNAAVHPFAKELCNGKDDNCRHGADEGCGAPAAFDGWRVMPVRSQGEFTRKELGGRAEQWLQGAARCAADPKVIYLSHDCSVIWRSRDGGKTWEKPLCHGLLLPHGQSIEVDPVDCDRVMIVVDSAWNYKNAAFTGIYLSEDGGEHFKRVQTGPTVHSRRYEHNIAFARASADQKGALTWYAALYNEAKEPGHDKSGIYRSDDRGATWKLLASLAQHYPVYEVQVSPADSKKVLVATGSGLLESTDGGATLKPAGNLPAGEVTSVAFSPKDASVVYAVARGSTAGGLHRSKDGGKTFSPVKSSDSLHQSVLGDARRIFVHEKDGDVFYVIPQSKTGGRTAIRTDDGGATFSATSISLPDDVKAWRWGINITGNFAFLLMSAADSRDVVAQSGGAALYRTTDGKLFKNGSTLYTGANCGGQNYSIGFDPADPERFVVGHQDIGMYLTENGGDWFVSRGAPHAWVGQGLISWTSQWTLDIHPNQPDHIVGVTGQSFDRKVLRTTDAGLKWTIADNQSGHYFRVVHHPYDPKLVFAGDRRSQDGGASYNQLPIPSALMDSGVQVMDLCRAQPDVVYAASRTSKRILRSTDKGKTWSLYVQAPASIAPFDPYITFAVDPSRCDVIYTLDAKGDLARYDGKSKSWTSLGVLKNVAPPKGYFVFVRSVKVDPHHSDVLYASIFGAGIPSAFRSADGGATWEDISFNRFREGFNGFNISPHTGEVFVGGCSGTWVLPPPYPTRNGIYEKLVPRPSCIDGIKNGKEEGIDCGGDCAATCQRDGLPVTDGPAAGDGPGGSDGGGGGGDTGRPASYADNGCGCRFHGAGGGLPLSCLILLALARLGIALGRKR
jgi:photosystem II stability/assembly factor-like uncharacterized protein